MVNDIIDMDIDLLINHNAEAELKPVLGRKRPAFQNPLCTSLIHNAVRSKSHRSSFRQRHTCALCVMDRVFQLVCSKVPKEAVVKKVTAEFRAYWCPFCIMEADLSPEALICCKPNAFLRNHCRVHADILAQKRCEHNKRWTDCCVCDDPRAGSSFCACGVKLGPMLKKNCCCRLNMVAAVACG